MGFPFRKFFTVVEQVAPIVLAVTPAGPLVPFIQQAIGLSEAFHTDAVQSPLTNDQKLAFARTQYRTSLEAMNAQAVAMTGHAVVQVDEALAAFDGQVAAIIAASKVKLQLPGAPPSLATPVAPVL